MFVKSTVMPFNGDMSRKKSGFVKNAVNYFSKFCDNTTIHGFKFLGEKRRSLVERLWWLFVIIISLCGCISLILSAYQKWISSPVIVSFATTQTSIRHIPFPAVTICSDIKSHAGVFNFTDVESKIQQHIASKEESQNYDYMEMVCEGEDMGWRNTSAKFINGSGLDFITTVAPTISNTIKAVKWRGVVYTETEHFFTPILNGEGVCYTFNILDRSNLFHDETINFRNFFRNGNSSTWTIEEGFAKNQSTKYPRSSVVSGIDGGIDFVLYVLDSDIDYRCKPDYVGFKVTFQHPALIPKGKKNSISIPPDQIVVAAVKPIMMRTSKKLRSYTPQKRQCFFISEKSLKFYKNYNQPNCLWECLTNATLEYCGCVALSMPRDNSTSICGPGLIDCMNKAKVLYLTQDFYSKNTTGETPKLFAEQCNCLPSCTSLDFEVELSQSDWNWQKIHPEKTEGAHYSKLRVFFKDMQFITSGRNELYGTTDFLASCGGLLGLFMGVSAISMFEVVYFLTLRLFCNIGRYGRRYWAGAEELIEVSVCKE